MSTSQFASRRSRHPRGLSIVELLVGITIGLFILAGGVVVATDQIVDNRRLLLETQVQQDMRSAMDIIVRDIRRSGFSHGSRDLPAVGASTTTYAYRSAGSTPTEDASVLEYTYSTSVTDNHTADSSNPADWPDFRGVRHQGDAIQVRLGWNNWQPLTDTEVLKITSFTAVATPVALNLPVCATPPCTGSGGCAGNASLVTNMLTLTMTGVARHDPRVERTLVANVRVRNDSLVCP
jgi:hypothetical protein